ncbi:MAG: hypothetical protein ABR587_06485 [Candidatus Binatia bacterium]
MHSTPTPFIRHGNLWSCFHIVAVVAVLHGNAHAIDTCKVKIDKTDGALVVSAKNVAANPRWGYAAGKEANVFANEGVCVASGKASKCELAASGAARTNPAPDCFVYLKDDSSSCAVRIKGCTPGLREVTADVSARVGNSVGQLIASGVNTVVTFDTEAWDTDGIHDTVVNTNRLTAQTAGKYLIYGHVSWASDPAGTRFMALTVNDFIIVSTENSPSVVGGGQVAATHYELGVGDFVNLVVFQNSGAPLSVLASGDRSPTLGMAKLP